MGVSITQMDYPYQTTNVAAVTGGADWKAAGSELTLPASTAFVAVSADEPFHLAFLEESATYGGADGVLFQADQVYRIPCFQQMFMNYKNQAGGSNATITVTAFVASKN